uniref:Uncharacterized protein n=1 Tax=Arion vulgaris TaxID=1028688 RepID=A0A0B7B0Z6_9EUPU
MKYQEKRQQTDWLRKLLQISNNDNENNNFKRRKVSLNQLTNTNTRQISNYK